MQGLRAAETSAPHVILLDYAMPVMSGAQVVRALASRPSLSGVPVVLVSAHDDPELDGIVGYLQKPVSLDALELLLKAFADEPTDAKVAARQLCHSCPFCGARQGEWCRRGATRADRLHGGRPTHRAGSRPS
jgi:CheY-like chemotaxis protein